MLKVSSALAPLADYSVFPYGGNPLLEADAISKTCYRPLVALDVATLRFGNMPRADAEGRDKLSSLGNLSSLISLAGFQTADLLSAFVTPGGPPLGRGGRLSPDFDLKEDPQFGRVNVLTNTDRPDRHNKVAPKHTSYFYNSHRPKWSVTMKIGSLRAP